MIAHGGGSATIERKSRDSEFGLRLKPSAQGRSNVTDIVDLRYPIGKPPMAKTISLEDRNYAVLTLAQMPELLREAIRGLDQEQINTPYREGGWTVRQLVHHIADSHMTAFHRIRRALTEGTPVVTSYDEAAFAQLPDSVAPVEWSLEIVEALHARWVMLLQALVEEQWQRSYKQGERVTTVDQVTQLYAWHSRHHVQHILGLRSRQGW
jgi:uncharacterized damage-inducible protein DinB